MICTASDFWDRVDMNNPYNTLTKLIANTNIDYVNLRRQRFDNRIPKTLDVYELSKALGTTMEYLLTGIEEKKEPPLPPRIRRIVLNLMHIATDEDLLLVERILRIDERKEVQDAECI